MTDRELLERAALAAGQPIEFTNDIPVAFIEDGELVPAWNPLTDDGDALRLAAQLNIIPRWINGKAFAWANGICELTETYGDKLAATRRAIVRAAAALGESE